MRIDDIAYQRATRVAAFGLALQTVIGLLLLVFGVLAQDTTFVHASVYALIGLFVWLSLVIVFNQHRLEQIEAKETDELQAQRLAGLGSAFESEPGEFQVAARRLRLMHTWLMPIVSWMVIILLAGLGIFLLWRLFQITAPGAMTTAEFDVVSEGNRGWALAICLGGAAISFIFSRFVAGMARQSVWQNLRGGAGYMVGNTLVLLALATGIIFTYFENEAVIRAVAHAILFFMVFYAAETILNFLLNLYRPRRPGEVPRPAFDSRVLSLLSAPDSIVRSINEAINYQFGFDITSSWGYQLLLRAVRKLAAFAVVILVLLNTLVIVEPHQQAIRLRGGAIVGDVHGAGLMFKWPWPFERAEVFDVARVRELPLTVQVRDTPALRNEPVLWSQDLDVNLGVVPFIVSTSTIRDEVPATIVEPPVAELDPDAEASPDEQAEQEAVQRVSGSFALIETEFVLHYRIRSDAEDGLIKFLTFSNDIIAPRQPLEMRERALKAIALREVTSIVSSKDLDRIISSDRAAMLDEMRTRIQEAFDEYETGVEVLTVSNPWLRPAGAAARHFEDLGFNIAGAEQQRAQARRAASAELTATAGSPENAEAILTEIRELARLRASGASEEEIAAQSFRIEQLLLEAGGDSARRIAEARMDLWLKALDAEARLQRFRGRLAPYEAGPEIYRQFLLMDVLGFALADARKYFLGADPSRFDLDVEILQDDTSLVFDESIAPGETVNGGNQ